MTLITCPECNKEISSRVKSCPNCGYPFEAEGVENDLQKVEIRSVNISPIDPIKKQKLIYAFGGLIGLIVVGYFLYMAYQNNKANSYVDNLNLLTTTMLTGGADAEELLNLTGRVWYNTIYEEHDTETDEYTRSGSFGFNDDFNDSLANLYADSNTISKISSIERNQEVVAELMKKLQNPPSDLETCYETASELYATYKGITDLAINPKGSLQSFSEDKNDKISKFMELYDKLKTQIPENN